MSPEDVKEAQLSRPPIWVPAVEHPKEPAEDSGQERLADALARACYYLLRQQNGDGHVCAELEADATLPSDLILLLHFLGREGRHHRFIEKARNEILRRQLPSGGWSIFPGGPDEISATVKAYFALKLAGLPMSSPALGRARETIRRLGGITRANTYTRFYLAIFGQYDWGGVPQILPEIMFLPAWFPINLYEISSWTRAIVVPLMIVNHYRPRIPVAPGRDIQELREGRRERKLYVSERNGGSSWKRIFVDLDRVLKLWNRWPLRPLRRRALKKATAWILERLNRSDGLAAIWPSMLNTVFALRCLGYADGHEDLERSVAALLDLVIEEEDTLRVQPCKSPVWDTALSMVTWIRAGKSSSSPALRAAARWLLDREVRLPGDWRVKRPWISPGGWYFEYANEFYPDLDDTAMVVTALSCVNLGAEQPILQAALDRAIAWVMAMQSRDGGWGAFDADNCNRILCDLPFADHNAMLDPSSPDVTARVLEMAGRLGFNRDDPHMDRAVQYLLRGQEEDGSWFGRWGVNHIYGTSEVLVGLHAVGFDMNRPEVVRAADWFERLQNPDGGWGERCDSYENPVYRGCGPSTASQTAWALLGLMAAGRWESRAVARGIEYLLGTQNRDGSWEEILFTGTGFPSVFYLRYHLYPQYFPTMALATYAERDMNRWPVAVKTKPSLTHYRNPPAGRRFRFPLHQSRRIGLYIVNGKLSRKRRFPLVLMLEPLHRCNLSCAGCGRVREYKDLLERQMTLDECLGAAEECNAPVVSICGGEPLLYEDIVPLAAGLVRQGRYVYLCTNGCHLAEMASRFAPSPYLIFNVHLDGLRDLHDAIVCRKGVFDLALSGIAVARELGFRVTTNTTFYGSTTAEELKALFEYLLPYGIEGHSISPAYAFNGTPADDGFISGRKVIAERFQELRPMARRFPLLASPVYIDFLLGKRDLPCTPWANPTRNVAGWRAPCYLLMDEHHPTFREYLEKVEWERLGPGNDPRCENCMVHAGFEPSAVLGRGGRLPDRLRIALWQFG